VAYFQEEILRCVEMDLPKKCPILSIEGNDYMDCLEEECAWYCEKLEMCAIKANALVIK
jgi:hypothetical protein